MHKSVIPVRDAGIHRPRMANCGSRPMPLYPQTVNYCFASHIKQALAQPTSYRPWPGFRHPCRNDGFFSSFPSSAWERGLGSSATPVVDSGSRASQTGFPSGAFSAMQKCWRPVIPVRDAGIHRPRMANCGSRPMPLYPQTVNYCFASHIKQALAQPTSYRPWPGFRHPCRNDDFSGLARLVYNDESGAWEPAVGRTWERATDAIRSRLFKPCP